MATIKYNQNGEWKELSIGGGESVEVVDNLESESTTAALSANQGRVLKEMIVQSGGGSTDVDIFPSEYSEEFNDDFTI